MTTNRRYHAAIYGRGLWPSFDLGLDADGGSVRLRPPVSFSVPMAWVTGVFLPSLFGAACVMLPS